MRCRQVWEFFLEFLTYFSGDFLSPQIETVSLVPVSRLLHGTESSFYSLTFSVTSVSDISSCFGKSCYERASAASIRSAPIRSISSVL